MAAVKCHICFQKTKEEDACHVCNASRRELSEGILMTVDGSFSIAEKGAGTDGTIHLTNKRLIGMVEKTNIFSWIVLFLFGWLASFLADIFTTKKKLSFSIPLEELDVSNFEECKLGLLTKGFMMRTTSGGFVRLSAEPSDVWKEAIAKAKADLKA
jgi:hypothetical protein